MKREIIAVTAADIERANALRAERTAYMQRAYPGYEGSGVHPNECPVACALMRIYQSEIAGANADFLSVRGKRSDGISRALRRFVRQWDRTWKAEPARFLVVWED
jgi:hypothetical protein